MSDNMIVQNYKKPENMKIPTLRIHQPIWVSAIMIMEPPGQGLEFNPTVHTHKPYTLNYVPQ